MPAWGQAKREFCWPWLTHIGYPSNLTGLRLPFTAQLRTQSCEWCRAAFRVSAQWKPASVPRRQTLLCVAEATTWGPRRTSRPLSELTLALQDLRGHPMRRSRRSYQPNIWRLARGRVEGLITMPSGGGPTTRPHPGLSLPGTKDTQQPG